MIALIFFVLAALASPFKSKRRLEAENAALQHQLIILRRKVRGRVQLTNGDRWFFVQLYRFATSRARTPISTYGQSAIWQAAIIESRPTNLRTSAMVTCAWLSSIEPKVS